MKIPAPKVLAGAAALAFFANTLTSATAATAPGGVERISAYAGTWHSRIVRYTTKYSRSRVETLTVRNDCWRSGDYYACDQIVDGRSMTLIVYTYDARQNLYNLHVIPKDGRPAAGGVLKISGNTWTFPWENIDKGKRLYIRVLNVFRDPNTIVFHEGFSYDNIHWTATADGIEHRLPG